VLRGLHRSTRQVKPVCRFAWCDSRGCVSPISFSEYASTRPEEPLLSRVGKPFLALRPPRKHAAHNGRQADCECARLRCVDRCPAGRPAFAPLRDRHEVLPGRAGSTRVRRAHDRFAIDARRRFFGKLPASLPRYCPLHSRLFLAPIGSPRYAQSQAVSAHCGRAS